MNGSAFHSVDWLSFGTGLAAVLLLIGVLYLALRWLGSGPSHRRSHRQITLVESHVLGNRHRLALMRVKGRDLLIGITQQNISVLAAWPDEPDPERQEPVRTTVPPSWQPTNGAGLKELIEKMQSRNGGKA